MNNLAIVIPAYKADFFEETLKSLAEQSDKRFVVYIGDDASPDDLLATVKPYQSRMNVVYRRFDLNMGSYDLVGHWERCLGMVDVQEWVWLFSDDDMMDPGCVEAFYRYVETNDDNADILHFDMKVIDQYGEQIWPFYPFPKHLHTPDFFTKRIRNQIHTTGVSYVFKKDIWESRGGFVKFDLAWFSDDATWMSLAANKGIRTIRGPLVYWRYSNRNISSILDDEPILRRKIKSGLEFMQWAKTFFEDNGWMQEYTEFEKVKFLLSMPLNASVLPWFSKSKYVRYICKEMNVNLLTKLAVYVYFGCFVLKDGLRKLIGKVNDS